MQAVATDAELLERWSAGDRAAGNDLFERYITQLFRFFQNKVQSGIEDLIQQTMLACVESRARFRGDSSFRTFLFQIARHQLYRYYRARNRGIEIDFETTGVADLGTSPTGALTRRQEHQFLLEALRRIPLQYQIVLELSICEELTGPEMAEILEIPEGTLRSRLRLATQHVRRELALISPASRLIEEPGSDFQAWSRGVRESFRRAFEAE